MMYAITCLAFLVVMGIALARAFIGPTIYGFLAFEAARWYENNKGLSALLAEQSGQRVAIGSIIIFLAAGLIILLGVVDPTKKYTES